MFVVYLKSLKFIDFLIFYRCVNTLVEIYII